MMRRCLAVIAALAVAGFAQEPAPESPDKKPPEKKEEPKPERTKEEKPKEKTASAKIGGADIRYVVQTGMMPILKEDGASRANVFYVYYAAADAEGKRLTAKDPQSRPITFCFNGGPGAAAVWLHLGGLGPKRIAFPPEGLTPATVLGTTDNPNSILDVTDLVFVDPVSTGLSRAAKGEKADQFFGVEEDVQAAGEFVRLFTTREQRWLSPKFLCGESYGVIRVAGLADFLQEKHGMYFEGVMLLSGLLNFQTLLPAIGNDLPFLLSLPTFTSVAHYHRKLAPELQADLPRAVQQAREFARGDYALALLKGRTLGDADRRSIAERLAHFTGLSAEQALQKELRFDPSYVREMLLRDKGKILGRFDARVVSQDADHADSEPEFDPSFSNIIGPFSGAVNAYIRADLGYESDHPYQVLSPLPWRYSQFTNRYVSMEGQLAKAMKRNPKLRVAVLVGASDLAVWPDAIRYSLEHLPIPASLRANIVSHEYASGHMMYLFQPDAEKLRRNLVEFVGRR